MAWGEKNRLVPHSPVLDEKKPGGTARDVVITPEQYRDVILPNIPGQHFKDLVVVAWEVGARPQEFLKAEARHYDRNKKWIVFAAKESKGKKWPRIIHLTDAAMDVVERLSKDHPTGRLFRNASGAWNNSSVNCEWVRLRHRLGFKKMKAEEIEPNDDEVAAKVKTPEDSPHRRTREDRAGAPRGGATQVPAGARLHSRAEVVPVPFSPLVARPDAESERGRSDVCSADGPPRPVHGREDLPAPVAGSGPLAGGSEEGGRVTGTGRTE
jgi:hypothetical protein